MAWDAGRNLRMRDRLAAGIERQLLLLDGNDDLQRTGRQLLGYPDLVGDVFACFVPLARAPHRRIQRLGLRLNDGAEQAPALIRSSWRCDRGERDGAYRDQHMGGDRKSVV